MTADRDREPMFGRRQLLLGGGTFLAGVAGITVWERTRSTSRATSTTTPATTAQPRTSAPETAPPRTSALGTASQSDASVPPVPSAVTTAVPTTAPVDVPASTPTSTSADARVADGPASYVAHGPPGVNNVALTFHLGGDPALVSELLDLLKSSGVTSTLFAIGDWLTANPALGHRAVEDGHELGNHTKSHQSMLTLSRSDVRAEIVGGGQALIPFVGSIGKWFRPSGTDVPNDVILEEAGLAGYPVSVGYDVDPRDYTQPGAATVVARVKDGLHPGAIVSLHFGHRDTITALPRIVDLLATTGLTPVTITGLLG